jgi:hypothetical protein
VNITTRDGVQHDMEKPEKIAYINLAVKISDLRDHLGEDYNWATNLDFGKNHGLVIETSEFVVPTALGCWYEAQSDN